MAKISFSKICPVCKSDRFESFERTWWMFLIPMFKHYRCSYCFARILVPFIVLK